MILATSLVFLSPILTTQPSEAAAPEVPLATPTPVTAVAPLAPRADWERMDSVFSYDYAQLTGVLADAEGFGLDFSKAWTDRWFVIGRFVEADVESRGVEADVTRFSAGVGYAHELEENLDVVVTGQLDFADVDVENAGDDDDLGIRVRGGARYMLNPNVELFGGLALFTTFDSDFTFDAGALYHFEQGFSAIAQIEHDQDDVISIGVRYNF